MKKFLSLLLALTLCLPLSVPALAAEEENSSAPVSGCSDWAAEDIATALELGFVPRELQNNYTQNITRKEFADIAVKFCAKQLRCDPGHLRVMLVVVSGLGTQKKMFEDCDVNTGDVEKAYAFGLVNGVGGNRFEPEREINRAEAATMLLNAYRVYTLDLYDENSTLIVDAPAPAYADSESIVDWAQAPAALLREWGVMFGAEDDKFDPTGLFTREQCIVAFMRMWRNAPISRGREGGSNLNPFTHEEWLAVAHRDFSCVEVWSDENEYCTLIIGYRSLPGAPTPPYLKAVYKSGGLDVYDHFFYGDPNMFDDYSNIKLHLDREDVTFGEEPYILNIRGTDTETGNQVVLTANLETQTVVSVVEV